MGLCHTKLPAVEDDQNSPHGCLQRKSRGRHDGFHHGKEFRFPQRYVYRPMDEFEVWVLFFSKSVNTASLGSSMIRVPTIADGVHSTNSTFEAMLLGDSMHCYSSKPKSDEIMDAGPQHESFEEQTACTVRKARRAAVEEEEKIDRENIASTSEEWNETPALDLNEVTVLDPIQDDLIDLVTALKSSYIFHNLDEETLCKIASIMDLESFEDGDVIIQQGQMPQNTDCLYCVANGEVMLRISGTQEETRDAIIKKSGWIFGDISLLFNSPRSASVVAFGECNVYSLNRVDFINLMKNVPKIRLLKFLRKLPFLKSVSDNKLLRFGEQVEVKTYNQGDLILDQSANNNCQFYVVRKGNVQVVHDGGVKESAREVSDSQKGDHLLGRGHFFGVDKEVHAAYYASTQIEVVIIRHEDYQNLGNISLYWKLIEDSIINILNELGTVDVSSLRLGDVVNQNYLSSAREGDILLQQGQNLRYLCVVVKGHIACIQPSSNEVDQTSAFIKTCNGTQYFGEDWNSLSISIGDIIATSSRLQYLQIPHRLLAQAGVKKRGLEVEEGPKISDRVLIAFSEDKKNEKTQIAFHDLEQHRVVGEGQYGKVRLVVHKHTGLKYALKSIQKSAVKDIKTVEHIIMERKVLSKLTGNKFLVGFQGAFQDESYLYLLMDWIPGGELFSRITLSGMLPEHHAAFYAANVVLAFNTMHQMDIIYRDLKPENILIGVNGYLRLSDYGFATIDDSTALTLCGTPDYQAPEIISRKGAHKASDFWALGVLIFEMLTGDAPFRSPTDDPWDTYRRILSGRFYIPDYVSEPAASLIGDLLEVDPERRLGSQSADGEYIKLHPWFQGVDWERLENQDMRAPFVPRLTNSMDTSCFDHYDNSTDRSLPLPKHSFFTKDHQWAHLWSWIEEF